MVVRKASCHTEKYSAPSCITAKEKPDTASSHVSGSCLIQPSYPFTFLLFYLFTLSHCLIPPQLRNTTFFGFCPPEANLPTYLPCALK